MQHQSKKPRPSIEDWKRTHHWQCLKVVGNEAVGPCPHCGDRGKPKSDRFHINLETGIFDCRKCGDFERILRAARLWNDPPAGSDRDRVSQPASRPGALPDCPQQPPETYPVDGRKVPVLRSHAWTDGTGRIVRWHLKLDGMDWRWWPFKVGAYDDFANRVPFYRSEDLKAADPMFVCEGEKDAETLIAKNLQATCRSTKWPSNAELYRVFDDREVVILPDDDDAGREQGRKAVMAIRKHGNPASVKILTLPRLIGDPGDSGFDVTDWMAAGGNVNTLVNMALETPEAPDIAPERDDGGGDAVEVPPMAFRDLTIPQADEIELPDMILSDALEARAVSMLYGKPGGGKSTLAVLEAVALATGRGDLLFDGAEVIQSKVGMLWCEESKPVLQAKLRAVLEHHQAIKDDDIAGQLALFEGDHGTHPGHLTRPKAIDQLHNQAIAAGVRVIYIDSLAVTAPEAERDNSVASDFMIGLIRLAQAINGSVCILHHDRKGPPGEKPEVSMDAARGASALMASVRIARHIQKIDKSSPKDVRFRVESTKSSNFAKPPDRLWGIKPVIMNIGKRRSVPVMVTAVEVNPLDGVNDAKKQAAWDALIALPFQERRCDSRSPGWVGNVIGNALGLDTGADRKNNKERDTHQIDNRKQCQAILDLWVRQGRLKRKKIEIERDGCGVRGASKRKIECYEEFPNGINLHQLHQSAPVDNF